MKEEDGSWTPSSCWQGYLLKRKGLKIDCPTNQVVTVAFLGRSALGRKGMTDNRRGISDRRGSVPIGSSRGGHSRSM